MSMYEILKSAHSGWRYIVLILLIAAVFKALTSWLGNRSYHEDTKKLNVFTLISVHIQFLLGLILYFLSPLTKGPTADALYRYWKMEHLAMMIIAVVLITIGNSKSKKAATAVQKHKFIAIFFGIGLVIILGAIFMMVNSDPSRKWFGFS